MNTHKSSEFADDLFEDDFNDAGAAMAERLNALPKLGPFWTVQDYAKLDFLIWELEPELPPFGRRMKHGRLQTQFRKEYGYVLASREVMDTMADLLRNAGPMLEVGSGSGYLSKELARLGLSTFAVDYVDYTLPNNGYPIDAVYQRDAQGDAVPFVAKGFGAVLMTWPPYDRPFALRVAKAMLPGQLLIYGGENAGGCTANQAFFDYLADTDRWERLFDLSDQLDAVHVTFCGDKDHWLMFRRLSDVPVARPWRKTLEN